MKSPVALFAYRRPEHLRRVVESLRANPEAAETDLYIYCDAARGPSDQSDVAAVTSYADTVSGFQTITVIKRDKNFGLSKSIIDGVTRMCDEYGKVIVLEDDLVTSPYFLNYMNNALNCYESDEKVISVHGYMYPVIAEIPETFFLRDPGCWGWGTWKRGWDLFEADGKKLREQLNVGGFGREFNFSDSYDYMGMLNAQIAGRNDSWAVRWYASAFLLNKLTLYPGKSLVRNIGHDGSGWHGGKSDKFSVELAANPVSVRGIEIEENQYARSALIKYLKSIRSSWRQKMVINIRSKIYDAYSSIFGK